MSGGAAAEYASGVENLGLGEAFLFLIVHGNTGAAFGAFTHGLFIRRKLMLATWAFDFDLTHNGSLSCGTAKNHIILKAG
jgi:hypothetical protein